MSEVCFAAESVFVSGCGCNKIIEEEGRWWRWMCVPTGGNALRCDAMRCIVRVGEDPLLRCFAWMGCSHL